MQTATSYQPAHDDFWTHDTHLFQGSFRYYRNMPRPVRGKIHLSEESYTTDKYEIVPIATRRGTRTYVMMHPYVFEPNIILTIGLYKEPKHYADQQEAIGESIASHSEGAREVQIGSAQAWYYHQDKTIVLWECFIDARFRDHHLAKDPQMKQLWTKFEQWLVQQFPEATRIATPSNDPIAQSIEEYQAFLRSLGYEPITEPAFGKTL